MFSYLLSKLWSKLAQFLISGQSSIRFECVVWNSNIEWSLLISHNLQFWYLVISSLTAYKFCAKNQVMVTSNFVVKSWETNLISCIFMLWKVISSSQFARQGKFWHYKIDTIQDCFVEVVHETTYASSWNKNMWFHSQIAQKILNGIYYKLPMHLFNLHESWKVSKIWMLASAICHVQFVF